MSPLRQLSITPKTCSTASPTTVQNQKGLLPDSQSDIVVEIPVTETYSDENEERRF
jgi:hypothetical protein